MARITYKNGTNKINLELDGKDAFQYTPKNKRNTNKSATLSETIVERHDMEVKLSCFFGSTKYYDLQGWWSYADRGNTFSVAYSTDRMGYEDIITAMTSGTKIAYPRSIANFAADEILLVQDVDKSIYEVIVVDETSAVTPKIKTKQNLINSYTTDASIRHLDYFPSVLTNDNNFKPTRTGVTNTNSEYYYRATLNFVESS